MKDFWKIAWYHCRADKSDVEHQKKKYNKDIPVGHVFWQRPHSIGPIDSDHFHWGGDLFVLSEDGMNPPEKLDYPEETREEQTMIAVSALPALMDLLRKAMTCNDPHINTLARHIDARMKRDFYDLEINKQESHHE